MSLKVTLLALLMSARIAMAVEPSMTLPVLHISTADRVPVDQKEFYIDATAWIEVPAGSGYEPLGSEEAPVELGIRGRGNASWTNNVKKPYKLKFQKKAEPLGLSRSKHFALLHYPGNNATVFREPLGFELGRRIGLAWTPEQRPVEVVLNGEYLGFYYLTESIKADPLRVNVTKQPDLSNVDVERGWLVEIDNYADEYQTLFTLPDGFGLRLTHKSPEVLSEEQQAYIDGNFSSLIEAVYDEESDAWKDYIDVESCARYYIVQEIIHNYDAFNGSYFLHKEDGDRWTFGPLWDLSYSLNKIKSTSILEDLPPTNYPKLMPQLLRFREFKEAVRREWRQFYAQGTDWLDGVAAEMGEEVYEAGMRDAERWATESDNMRSGAMTSARLIKGNIEWLDGYFASEEFTSGIPAAETGAGNGYRLDGRRLSAEAGARVFDACGREIGARTAGEFELPSAGVYLLRTGARTRRLLVR